MGADRGLKRLRVCACSTSSSTRRSRAAQDGHPRVEHQLHYALSLMLTEGSTRLVVVGEDDQPTGYMTLDAISRLHV